MKLELLPPEELFEAISQLLQDGYDAEFTVTGNSMWPMLAHGRDRVILRKTEVSSLNKGDVVLLQSEHGYILHRITRMKNSMVQTTGDYNCYSDEFVPVQCVLGRVIRFIRKGRTISCSNPVYRLYSLFWRLLFPIRPLFLRVFLALRRRKR